MKGPLDGLVKLLPSTGAHDRRWARPEQAKSAKEKEPSNTCSEKLRCVERINLKAWVAKEMARSWTASELCLTCGMLPPVCRISPKAGQWLSTNTCCTEPWTHIRSLVCGRHDPAIRNWRQRRRDCRLVKGGTPVLATMEVAISISISSRTIPL